MGCVVCCAADCAVCVACCICGVTSIAFCVSYEELFTIGKQIANSQTSFMPFLIAGIFYFVFNGIVDVVMGRIEKRMDYYQ